MRLPAPDPLTIILIYISAIQMALNAALAPGTALAESFPGLTMAGIWPYVPIVLLSVATILWVTRGSGGRPLGHTQQPGPVIPPTQGPFPQVYTPAPSPRWWEKLESFQIYMLVYMGMMFIYLTVKAIFGH